MGDLVDATYLELEFDVIECTVLSLIRDVTFYSPAPFRKPTSIMADWKIVLEFFDFWARQK